MLKFRIYCRYNVSGFLSVARRKEEEYYGRATIQKRGPGQDKRPKHYPRGRHGNCYHDVRRAILGQVGQYQPTFAGPPTVVAGARLLADSGNSSLPHNNAVLPMPPRTIGTSGLLFCWARVGPLPRWAAQLLGSDGLDSVAGLSTPVSAWWSRNPMLRTCRLKAAEPEAKAATARPPTATA